MDEFLAGIADVWKKEVQQRTDDERGICRGAIWTREEEDDSYPNEERRV